jgi:pentatricopeptide repeat protein
LFGAVLHSLATSGRHDDAHELFRSLNYGETDLAVTPGVSCYNSILLAHVRTREWDDAIQVRETMKAQGIAINPQTIQGLVLAHNHKGGRSDVVSFLETLLGAKASIDESTFRLLVRVLLPQVDGNTEDMRKRVREIGETNPELRDASLNLIRSVRVAEIEQNRPSPKNRPSSEINARIEEAWNSVLPHFLEFVHAISRE